jgi:hypothetical protein
MSERFEIGEKERHIVTVDTNIVSKFITIDVDGQSQVRDWHPSPFAKKFNFEVGTSETHIVEVHVGPFTAAKVLVDGKPVPRLM